MAQQGTAKERICDALLDLMEERPFEEIPVTEITRQAGVSRTIFYRYFDSVYDVLQKIEDDYLEGLPTEGDAVDVLSETSRPSGADGPFRTTDYAQYIADHLHMYRVLIGPNGEPSFESRLHNRIYRISLQTIRLRIGENRPEAEPMAEYLASALNGAIRWWAMHEDEVDTESMSLLLSSISSNATRAVIECDQRLGIDIRRRGQE